MGKHRHGGEKEYSRLQQALYENKKLKREIASLRKQLARLDLDRHSYVREIIEKSYELEESLNSHQLLDKMKKEWVCHKCGKGHLEIMIYNRPDGTFYYRKCTNCENRTLAKKYDGQVKGIRAGEVPK